MEQEQFSSLAEHLSELRSRLIKIIVVLAIAITALSPFLQEIMRLITYPILHTLPRGNKMSITGVLEGVIVPFKMLLGCAFVLTLPFTLYQIWCFIAPGLYQKEKKIILQLVLFSLLMFVLGMLFCFFIFMPLLFRVSAHFTPKTVALYIPTISNYLNFIIRMLITFGFAFQLPILMLVSQQMELTTFDTFKKRRSYAIIAAFGIAAIVTPPDIMSQFFLAIPLIILYEGGLLLCRINQYKTR